MLDFLMDDLQLGEDAADLRRGPILKTIDAAAAKKLADHRNKSKEADWRRTDNFVEVFEKQLNY